MSRHDREMLNIVGSLGGSGGCYEIDRAAALKRIVGEIYCPPRVTTAIKLLHSLKLIRHELTVNDDDGMPWVFTKSEIDYLKKRDPPILGRLSMMPSTVVRLLTYADKSPQQHCTSCLYVA